MTMTRTRPVKLAPKALMARERMMRARSVWSRSVRRMRCEVAMGEPGEVARVLGDVHLRDERERGDADEHRDRQCAHDHERLLRVLRLRLLECRDAVRNRLNAGERRTSGRERAQREEAE